MKWYPLDSQSRAATARMKIWLFMAQIQIEEDVRIRAELSLVIDEA